MPRFSLDSPYVPHPDHSSDSGRPAPRSPTGARDRLEDRQVAAMEQAFQRHGGVATVDGIARLLRRSSNETLSTIDRWIVERTTVQYVWQSRTHMPLFQFDRRRMSLIDSAADVVRDLRDALDDWDLALWFASPNARLHGAVPVDVLAYDGAAVVRAARIDRFVARG